MKFGGGVGKVYMDVLRESESVKDSFIAAKKQHANSFQGYSEFLLSD